MRGFRIGRVSGVDLRVDWSWVFIFVLLTWNLVAVFSRWHPDWSPLGALATAVVASLVFFGCVVIHELAHSLVAMRYGVPVRSITLFLFGGVSNIEQEPPSPRAEFLMAIAGPIASVVLGIVFLAVGSLATSVPMDDAEGSWTAMERLGPLATLLVWLGPINILIGLFNMIPGFPLDGGRVLRSILWKASGDLATATRWAAATGQAIGWLLIAGGIAMTFGAYLPFFGTGFVSGLWLAFIGWFLNGAAAQAETRLAVDEAMGGVAVEHLMQRQGPVATPDLSVAALVHDLLIPGDDRALPVVEDGMLVGLVSTSDVRELRPEQWSGTSVAAIMRPVDALSVATPDEPLARAFGLLAQQDIDQMPVVVDGRLVGMLRRRDVTRWLELAWRPAARGAGRRAGGGATPDSRSRGESRGGFPGEGAHHAR